MSLNGKKDRITIYEVAKASNVSLATVSRVINNHPNVREETRRIVNETIERLSYRPSALAQGLAKNKSTNIGLVIPSANYNYISNMLSGMADIAKIYGYLTTLFITKPIEEDNNQMTEKLITSHVDGAVIYDDKLNDDSLRLIQNYKIPLVIIGREMDGDLLSSIVIDYKTPLLQVVSNYYKCGGDNIVYLTHDNQGNILNNLAENVNDFSTAQDKHITFMNVEDNYSLLYERMLEYFKTNKKGYFIVPRDSFALAIVNAAIESGLSVPDDIEVLSIIGTKYSYMHRPMISSLNVDMFEVGSIAMRMLTKILDNSLKSKVFRFKAEYVSRQSTKK